MAHLAGALGYPVWVVLSHGGDWHKLCDYEINSWYPSVRHFRQLAPGDWASVIGTVLGAFDDFDPNA